MSGGYQILRRMAQGSQAAVFECLSKERTIRVLRIPGESTPGEAEFFRALQKAQPGRFIKCLDEVEVTIEGAKYRGLIMEHGGESLRSLLCRQGKLSASSALSIHQQTCEGIEEIEGMGYYHLDIGPSNVLIDELGEVKICDAGNAVRIKDFVFTSYTNNRRYGAPSCYTRNPDLFSAALTLFEAVTGEHLLMPFSVAADFEDTKQRTSEIKRSFYAQREVNAVHLARIQAVGGEVGARILELLSI